MFESREPHGFLKTFGSCLGPIPLLRDSLSGFLLGSTCSFLTGTILVEFSQDGVLDRVRDTSVKMTSCNDDAKSDAVPNVTKSHSAIDVFAAAKSVAHSGSQEDFAEHCQPFIWGPNAPGGAEASCLLRTKSCFF